MNIRLFAILVFIVITTNGSAQEPVLQDTVVNKTILKRAIITEASFYIGGMSYLGFIWYKDKERVPFNFYNDGAGYLQIDKMGHAYGSYLESYIGYQWLRKAGVDKKRSLIYGGGLGFILQAPIEIFDGLYEGWGFSTWDVIANFSGAAILIGQELLWDRQPIRYKFSYTRSNYAKQGNGYLGDTKLESLFLDYNAHTYWLSGGLYNINSKIPKWINIAFGYSANGMYGEFTNRTYYQGEYLPQVNRHRQFLLSPDINWDEIPTKSKLLKHIFWGLNFIKIPFPTLEYSNENGFKGYWMYF